MRTPSNKELSDAHIVTKLAAKTWFILFMGSASSETFVKDKVNLLLGQTSRSCDRTLSPITLC